MGEEKKKALHIFPMPDSNASIMQKNDLTDSVFLYTTDRWHGFEHVFHHNCNKACCTYLPGDKVVKILLFICYTENVKHALITSLLISLLNLLFRLKFDCTSNN